MSRLKLRGAIIFFLISLLSLCSMVSIVVYLLHKELMSNDGLTALVALGVVVTTTGLLFPISVGIGFWVSHKTLRQSPSDKVDG